MKNKLWLVALGIGFTWDFMFWERVPGISYPIFIILCLGVAYFILRAEGHCPSRASICLIGAIVLLASFTFFRNEFFTRFTAFAFSILLTGILASTYQSGAWPHFNLVDYIKKLLHFLPQLLVLPGKDWFFHDQDADQKKQALGISAFRKIARGLVFSIPILIVFIALLSSADLIFAQQLKNVFRFLDLRHLVEFHIRGFLILMIAFFFTGLVSYAKIFGHKKDAPGNQKSVISPILGFTEGATILISVIILFSVFVIIQFRYFFSGEINITSFGFTYSQYARRGFAELVLVAIFSAMLIQGISALLIINTTKQERIFTTLVSVLVLLVLVILASSFQRLLLVESAYGFTSLRAYAHIFIIWLGIFLVSIIILEFIRQPGFFMNAVLLASAGFVITLNLINVDALIVHHNIRRAAQGKDLDASYLALLSGDATPQLVKEYISPDNSSEVRDEIGAVLVCRNLAAEGSDHESSNSDWRSFHYANWRAKEMLKTIENDLDRYQINKGDDELIVYGPVGVKFFCPAPAVFE